MTDEVLVWLFVWSEVQVVCIMVQLIPLTSQNPIISCLLKIQTGFTFLLPAYQVVLEKRQLNGCCSSSSSKSSIGGPTLAYFNITQDKASQNAKQTHGPTLVMLTCDQNVLIAWSAFYFYY